MKGIRDEIDHLSGPLEITDIGAQRARTEWSRIILKTEAVTTW